MVDLSASPPNMAFVKQLFNRGVQFLRQFLLIAGLGMMHGNRHADTDDHFTAARKKLAFWQDIVGTVESDRNNRNSSLGSQQDRPSFKFLKRSIGAAGTLGENEHRTARRYPFGGFIKTFQSLAAMGPVDRYIASPMHGLAEERDAEKFLFGEPAKIMGEIPLE